MGTYLVGKTINNKNKKKGYQHVIFKKMVLLLAITAALLVSGCAPSSNSQPHPLLLR